jgi:hypothetical protein
MTKTEASAIRPFHVSFPEAELTELRRRVNATRWPERETVTDATQGVQLATVQKLADYWGKDYDWSKCEAKLNALPNFMTEIDGLDIHFIHVRSKHEDALPLIVTIGDSDLRAVVSEVPASVSDVYRQSVAEELLKQREKALRRITHAGGLALAPVTLETCSCLLHWPSRRPLVPPLFSPETATPQEFTSRAVLRRMSPAR